LKKLGGPCWKILLGFPCWNCENAKQSQQDSSTQAERTEKISLEN